MRKVVTLPAALIVALAGYLCQPVALAQPPTAAIKVNPLRDAYYGDLHLHTSYSFDAYVYAGTRVDPGEAYRFAKGEVVEYLGQRVQRREPLDFLAVTDHAECIGVFNGLDESDDVVSRSKPGKVLEAYLQLITGPDGRRFFYDEKQKAHKLPAEFEKWPSDKSILSGKLEAVARSAWRREIDFANKNYEPGKFTTFIAYEWTSMPNADNLHRNVIFEGNSAPYPFTSIDSQKPEALWAWLEKIRKKGYEALAIPHNGNGSDGLMYDWVDSGGKPIDETYAERRQLNEPLSEISQQKGQSETHPLLSPNDEFANYEIFDSFAGDRGHEGRIPGSYLRDALSRGLVLRRKVGANPFKYGFVGASDLHGGLQVSTQTDYAGDTTNINLGPGKPTTEQAVSILTPASYTLRTTAGNLTGVWAESNTRESIYDAFRRRETFATTGTKLKFRFFGGWGFDKKLLKQKDWVATAYKRGVPMGGDLPAKPESAKAPTFAIWAVKDPDSGNLDRVQVIKVWEEDGNQKEKVFDVAWAGHRRPDPKTGKLSAVGDTVDLMTGRYTNDIGATELKTVWKDPEFNPDHFVAYYLRVLEIPTPRWSTLLVIQHGLPLPKDVPATEQQRGWSSPIWHQSSQR